MQLDLINDETDELFESIELDDNLVKTLRESWELTQISFEDYIKQILTEALDMVDESI